VHSVGESVDLKIVVINIIIKALNKIVHFTNFNPGTWWVGNRCSARFFASACKTVYPDY
jgi:hypothetical protein